MQVTKRSYAVIGAGAVGGFYGAKLAAAGHEVHFLARSDADHMRHHGLLVTSPTGDVTLDPVAVYDDPAALPPVDAVLIGLKTTANDALARLLGPVLATAAAAGRSAPVLVPLQNGLGVEDQVAAAAPGAPVVGGMCFICSTKVAPGRVEHIDYGAVTYAERTTDGQPAGVTELVQALTDDLVAAGIEAEARPDLGVARWRKLAWNIPFNGLSVVLDAGTDELMGDPAARSLAADLMGEVVAASDACGSAIGPEFADRMLEHTQVMTPYAPSMKVDFDARRPLEIAAIYEAPVAAAAVAGYDMVRTDALARQLRFLDTRNRAR
jgi:2-dehydropantoate 2-reductase